MNSPAEPKSPVVSRLTRTAERWFGVPLGDLLNLALFILTVVSLVIAFAGTYIAYVTLRDARASGAQQEKALKDSQEALARSSESLQQVLELTSAQQQRLERQIEIAKKQQNLLGEDVVTAKSQLEIVKKEHAEQERIASLKPDMDFILICDGIDLVQKMRTHWSEKQKLRVSAGENAPCILNLRNTGSDVLRNAHFSIGTFAGTDEIGVSLAKDGYDHQPMREFGSRQVLIDGKDLQPQSIELSLPTFYLLLAIPPKVDFFELSLELWGEKYEAAIPEIRIDVQR